MTILTRSGRIMLLLVLNVVMFLAEIIVGYKTGSLALIADAFHMLSDVLAQVIALYAIRLAAKTKWQPTMSYGWQRAELLGALYNGVFLLALCFSIFLDAIERFFKPEDIEDPTLVLIVGGIGLACNLVGLVLFHDHAGHSHGHSHSHNHSHSHSHSKEKKPQSLVAAQDVASPVPSDPEKASQGRPHSLRYHSSLERISPIREDTSNVGMNRSSMEDLGAARSTIQPTAVVVSMDDDEGFDNHNHEHGADPAHNHYTEHRHDHKGGKKGEKPSGQDLNMRGIFLHVLGDALGSVGVIFTALFIWKTDYSWRFYMDPIVSLFIAVIIVHSAYPLVRSASFILMQGVPVGVEIEEIRKEIKAIPDVISIHDLHIWQLTNIKMVASLHVLVTNQQAFERVSRIVKIIMHRAGIHSTTIQPEFPSMHPYLSQVARANCRSGLKNNLSDEEAHDLLSKAELSSRATSISGQSSNILRGPSTSQMATPARAGDAADSGLIVLSAHEQTAVDEANCVLLCVDGEEACNVGSCCTLPVKR